MFFLLTWPSEMLKPWALLHVMIWFPGRREVFVIVGCNICVNVLFHGFMACIFQFVKSNICGAKVIYVVQLLEYMWPGSLRKRTEYKTECRPKHMYNVWVSIPYIYLIPPQKNTCRKKQISEKQKKHALSYICPPPKKINTCRKKNISENNQKKKTIPRPEDLFFCLPLNGLKSTCSDQPGSSMASMPGAKLIPPESQIPWLWGTYRWIFSGRFEVTNKQINK